MSAVLDLLKYSPEQDPYLPHLLTGSADGGSGGRGLEDATGFEDPDDPEGGWPILWLGGLVDFGANVQIIPVNPQNPHLN